MYRYNLVLLPILMLSAIGGALWAYLSFGFAPFPMVIFWEGVMLLAIMSPRSLLRSKTCDNKAKRNYLRSLTSSAILAVNLVTVYFLLEHVSIYYIFDSYVPAWAIALDCAYYLAWVFVILKLASIALNPHTSISITPLAPLIIMAFALFIQFEAVPTIVENQGPVAQSRVFAETVLKSNDEEEVGLIAAYTTVRFALLEPDLSFDIATKDLGLDLNCFEISAILNSLVRDAYVDYLTNPEYRYMQAMRQNLNAVTPDLAFELMETLAHDNVLFHDCSNPNIYEDNTAKGGA